MWLLSPQAIILIVAMALSATAGWRVTANHYQNQIAQTELEQAKDTLERERLVAEVKEKNHALSVAGLELSGVISERNANRHEKIRVITIEVIREVIKYRHLPPVRPVDGTCYIDAEWVRIHDLAASSGVPDTTASAAEPVAAATYADTLEIVTTNYATCEKLRATVIGWQEFYEGLRRLHEH